MLGRWPCRSNRTRGSHQRYPPGSVAKASGEREVLVSGTYLAPRTPRSRERNLTYNAVVLGLSCQRSPCSHCIDQPYARSTTHPSAKALPHDARIWTHGDVYRIIRYPEDGCTYHRVKRTAVTHQRAKIALVGPSGPFSGWIRAGERYESFNARGKLEVEEVS